MPHHPKFVMIAAPHTSNWDFLMTMILAFSFRIKVFWMGKHTIFRFPFHGLCRWLGGIPVDRRRAGNMVARCIEEFNRNERLIMIIPPEGTRKRVRYWKTGFYHIARGAGVPIVLGYVDYLRKAGGLGPVFFPTGDMENDMSFIREYYGKVTGKRPEVWSAAAVTVRR